MKTLQLEMQRLTCYAVLGWSALTQNFSGLPLIDFEVFNGWDVLSPLYHLVFYKIYELIINVTFNLSIKQIINRPSRFWMCQPIRCESSLWAYTLGFKRAFIFVSVSGSCGETDRVESNNFCVRFVIRCKKNNVIRLNRSRNPSNKS